MAHLCRLARCSKVVSYLRYCGRAGRTAAIAVFDPEETLGPVAAPTQANLRRRLHQARIHRSQTPLARPQKSQPPVVNSGALPGRVPNISSSLNFVNSLLISRRLYIELTVVEAGALEPRWDAVEAARASGVSVGTRAREDCIDTAPSALLGFPDEASGDRRAVVERIRAIAAYGARTFTQVG